MSTGIEWLSALMLGMFRWRQMMIAAAALGFAWLAVAALKYPAPVWLKTGIVAVGGALSGGVMFYAWRH